MTDGEKLAILDIEEQAAWDICDGHSGINDDPLLIRQLEIIERCQRIRENLLRSRPPDGYAVDGTGIRLVPTGH